MEKKGQVVVGTIMAVIIAVVVISVAWNFTQGASGDLLVNNENLAVTNATNKSLANNWESISRIRCTNGTTMTLNSDYYIFTKNLYYNQTNVCGAVATSQNWLVDYYYRSTLYLGSGSGLTRTVLSYSIIGVILSVLLVAFYLGARE